MRFLQPVQRVHRRTVEQPKITGRLRRVGFGQPRKQPVVEPGRPALEGGLALSAAAYSQNDTTPFFPLTDELGDHLGRILKIRVDRYDGVAGSQLVAARDGGLMPKVPREADPVEARVGTASILDESPGLVAAPVVDEDDLNAVAIGEVIHHGCGPGHEGG
jgi:hypothetical protein